MNLSDFLSEDTYVDYSSPIIAKNAEQLFRFICTDIKKAKTAYEFVRDEIPHSFDIKAEVITAKASDVLKFKTGICDAKANLLAALLRLQGIPTGFCFAHITLADDDSPGYCVHCYNAVYLDDRWIKVDARGNINGINAQFSLDTPILAFPNRPDYDEYFWPVIYANPHPDTMQLLENASSIQYVIDNLPDFIKEKPDIMD